MSSKPTHEVTLAEVEAARISYIDAQVDYELSSDTWLAHLAAARHYVALRDRYRKQVGDAK